MPENLGMSKKEQEELWVRLTRIWLDLTHIHVLSTKDPIPSKPLFLSLLQFLQKYHISFELVVIICVDFAENVCWKMRTSLILYKDQLQGSFFFWVFLVFEVRKLGKSQNFWLSKKIASFFRRFAAQIAPSLNQQSCSKVFSFSNFLYLLCKGIVYKRLWY